MEPITHKIRKLSYYAGTCLLFLFLLLTGCASDNTCKYIADKPVFFPPPPDEPHIQYLTGINSTDDIGEGKKKSSFSLVVTGSEKGDIVKKIGKSFGVTAYKGKLYVAEGMNGTVSIVDPVKGTIESPVGTTSSRGGLRYPVNLDLDDDGNLYVVDTTRRDIVVYDAAGNYKNSFGKSFGPKSKITDVKIFKGKLYALDLGASLVRVLDKNTGEQEAEFGKNDNLSQSLQLPSNFTIGPDGNLYITNIGSSKVLKLDVDGNYIGSFGGIGDQFGQFSKPKGIALDKEQRIYVVDGGTNLVQVFDDQFRMLTLFGWPGLPYGSLNGPSGIEVSTDNLDYFQKFAAPGFKLEALIYVVSQFGQEFCIPRISVYGLGNMVKK